MSLIQKQMKIYNSYAEEPDDVFLPLSKKLYCDFYSLEMDGFSADMPFYINHLPPEGRILEIGCGTGRVCRRLTGEKRKTTGIDISLAMTAKAKRLSPDSCDYLCMDMLHLAFSSGFDGIVAPYNSLNLLTNKSIILKCLRQCATHLKPRKPLCLQLYVPNKKVLAQKKKTFQFQMLERPEGGRIIKEVLKKYIPHSQTIEIEERYRVRPMSKGGVNQDYNHCYTLAAFSFQTWLNLFKQAGFTLIKSYGDYDLAPFISGKDTTLLAVLRKKPPERHRPV
jgi:SAM-dependent methyltransferase